MRWNQHFEEIKPCRVKQTQAPAANGPRLLSSPWEATTALLSDTNHHRNQPVVNAGQVHMLFDPGLPTRGEGHIIEADATRWTCRSGPSARS